MKDEKEAKRGGVREEERLLEVEWTEGRLTPTPLMDSVQSTGTDTGARRLG